MEVGARYSLVEQLTDIVVLNVLSDHRAPGHAGQPGGDVGGRRKETQRAIRLTKWAAMDSCPHLAQKNHASVGFSPLP